MGRRFCFTFGTVDGSCPFHPYGSKKSSKWLLCLRATSGIVILLGSLTVLPSLAVVLSYAQEQIGQPQEVAFHILHPYGKARTRTTKKDRLSVPSESTEVTAKAATVDELAGPVAQLMLDPPKSPEVVYAPTRPTNWGQDTAPDSGSSDRTSDSHRSVGRQHKGGHAAAHSCLHHHGCGA